MLNYYKEFEDIAGSRSVEGLITNKSNPFCTLKVRYWGRLAIVIVSWCKFIFYYFQSTLTDTGCVTHCLRETKSRCSEAAHQLFPLFNCAIPGPSRWRRNVPSIKSLWTQIFKPQWFSYHTFTADCVATLVCLLFCWVVSCGPASNPLKSLEESNNRNAHLSKREEGEN